MSVSRFSLMENVKSFLPRRLWFAYLLGLLVPGVVLAAVYVFNGGPSIAGSENWGLVDSMLFDTALVTASLMVSGLYFFFRRDFSTAVAPILGVATSLYSGFEDLMVYVFCTVKGTGDCGSVSGLPGKWSWLDGSTVGSTLSLLGFSGPVTDLGVFVSVLVWVLFSLVFVKILYVLEARFMGVPV